ncbi:MAG: phosphoribosyl transferase [Clostridia bacterium]|nr:phosphoribosyl transferase [Clostridia bacterium]
MKNLHKFPHDVDLIVGLPRSGMLPANLLALYLNKPYTDIDSFVDGRIYGCGNRGKLIESSILKKILIIDDSVSSGNALNIAKKKIAELQKSYSFIFSAIYAQRDSLSKVDIFCEIVEQPRCFQWNLFHHPLVLKNSFLDIDGVLCPNPPLDDDGLKYLAYLNSAPKLYIPSVEVDTLVSCRLEKYRGATEDWLKRNGVKYKKLVLLNLPSKKDRLVWGRHGEFKGKIYRKSNATLFVESSLHEAKKIFKIAKKPVFCIETFSMLNVCDTRHKVEIWSECIKNIVWRILTKMNILKKD